MVCKASLPNIAEFAILFLSLPSSIPDSVCPRSLEKGNYSVFRSTVPLWNVPPFSFSFFLPAMLLHALKTEREIKVWRKLKQRERGAEP